MFKENFIGSALSYPLATVYRQVVSLRNSLYNKGTLASVRGPLPTICVGNAIAGGSGKSPFVAFLAQELVALGYYPAIVSRGYGGQSRGPCLVRANQTVREVGDEALMQVRQLGNAIPVVVSRERLAGVQFVYDNSLADLVILDDGYQHRQLERDLNLLLLDTSTPESFDKWLNDKILPAGYLREPLAEAIARADCIVLVEKGETPQNRTKLLAALEKYRDSTPIIRARITPAHFLDEFSGKCYPLDYFSSNSSDTSSNQAAAACAIANPQSFFTMLSAQGIELEKTLARDDHQQFTRRDWEAISNLGKTPVFTTSKDAVKLKRFATKPGQLYTLAIKVELPVAAQREWFWQLVGAVLDPRRLRGTGQINEQSTK